MVRKSVPHPLPAEAKLLAAAIVLGIVHLHVSAMAARRQQSYAWGAGPRDEPRPLHGVPARLERAFGNFLETFPLFATSVLLAWTSARLGPFTYWGALLYVVCRALYVPLYAAGIPYARTAIWQLGVAGQLLVLVPLFS